MPTHKKSYLNEYISLITNSLKVLTNIVIVDFSLSLEEQAQHVFNSDYILLAHNGSEDPVFNYANQSALELFEMSWEEITSLPSKYSSESDQRREREKLLSDVSKNGYSKNYSGIRVSKTGKRFKIKDVIVWNIYDSDKNTIGQAALFYKYEYL